MKTMKKYAPLAAAVLAVALLTAALITGCTSPVDGSIITQNQSGGGIGGSSLQEIPAGMGVVQLNFGNNTNARATFLPDTISYDAFLHYRLIFTAKTGAGETGVTATVDIGASSVNPTTGALTTNITLIAGNYDSVAVTAYTTAGTTGNTALGSTGAIPNPATPVAKGTYDNGGAGFAVTTGTNGNITIILAAIIDGDTDTTTQGTLTWSVNNGITGHTPSAATITITPAKTRNPTVFSSLPGTALGTPTVNLYTTVIANPWTGNGTPVKLDSGYYFVDFKVTAESLTATQTHLVHIYQNMTTPVTGLTFTNDHFGGFVTPPPTGGQGGSFSYTHPSANPLHIDIDPTGAPGITGDGTSGVTPYLLIGTEYLVIMIDETDIDEYTGISWEIDGVVVTTGLSAINPGVAPAGATLTLTRGQAPIAASAAKGYYALTVSGLKNGTELLENNVPIYIQVAP